MGESVRALKEMTFGGMLDYSIEVYKRNFKKVTILALIFHVPFVFLYTLFSSYIYKDLVKFVDIYSDSYVEGPMYTLMAYYMSVAVAWLIYNIYKITIGTVMEASIAKIIYSDVVYKEEYNAKSAIKDGFKKFWHLLIYRILYGLINLGISTCVMLAAYFFIIAIVLGLALSAASFAGTGISTGAIVGIVISVIFIVLMVLGILLIIYYFRIKFGFGVYSIITEDKSPTESISRSSLLTKDNFWHAGLTYFFGYLLVMIIPMLVSAAAQFTQFINGNLFVVLTTVAQVISAIIYPYLIILMTIIFINLKIKKEGLDLEVKVDKLLEQQDKLLNGEIANV